MRLGGLDNLSGIAIPRSNALDDLNIPRGRSHTIVASDPILGASVAEPEQHWGKSRDHVVGVCDAVGAPLVGDILDQFLVTNAGTAVWVLLAVIHLLG
jgi:hypothetical protein